VEKSFRYFLGKVVATIMFRGKPQKFILITFRRNLSITFLLNKFLESFVLTFYQKKFPYITLKLWKTGKWKEKNERKAQLADI
jgi:hypothetical protein